MVSIKHMILSTCLMSISAVSYANDILVAQKLMDEMCSQEKQLIAVERILTEKLEYLSSFDKDLQCDVDTIMRAKKSIAERIFFNKIYPGIAGIAGLITIITETSFTTFAVLNLLLFHLPGYFKKSKAAQKDQPVKND